METSDNVFFDNLFIIFLIVTLIALAKKNARLKSTKSIDVSKEAVNFVTVNASYLLWFNFLRTTHWKDKALLERWNFSFFAWLVIYAAYIGLGVCFIILSYKKKLNTTMISNIILRIVSLFGFALSCSECKKLSNKKFLLENVPELPYESCTCESGCRCDISIDIVRLFGL